MSNTNERLKELKKELKQIEEKLKYIKFKIDCLEEETREEYDGSWYTEHGHGD